MTTNPAALMRMLITYAICIPLAIVIGYVLTDVGNSPNYTNLFEVGFVVAIVLSPIFIKWHYPIMVFGLSCPMYLFFIKGTPPLWQVIVIISLSIAIVERAINSKRRFISAPSIVWPLLFTVAMALATAKLTGGIGLHQLGGDVSGGKKYILLFLGIAVFFALTSQKIPKERRSLYVGLFILSGVLTFVGDLAVMLPSPLNYINFIFPPSIQNDVPVEIGQTRLGNFATAAGTLANFMMARFGLRGIFSGGKNWWRTPAFLLLLILTLLGGFRTIVFTYAALCILMFFLEGLHRTRLLPVFLFAGVLGISLLVPLVHKLPFTFQRALSFLPLDIDPLAAADAEGSSEWRYRMWHDLWPQVPQYLLLGKGYALSATDIGMIGDSALSSGAEVRMDSSQQSLAISGDYHNGPLSVLMPFGAWGGIAFIWFTLAGLRVLYRNFKYGDPQIKTTNIFLLANYLQHYFGFFFIFGSYSSDTFFFAGIIGFSIALNGGVLGPQPKPNPTAGQFKLSRKNQLQPA